MRGAGQIGICGVHLAILSRRGGLSHQSGQSKASRSCKSEPPSLHPTNSRLLAILLHSPFRKTCLLLKHGKESINHSPCVLADTAEQLAHEFCTTRDKPGLAAHHSCLVWPPCGAQHQRKAL